MSTLLSRIFGRKKEEVGEPRASDTLDVSALKPLMSPQQFANMKTSAAPAPAISSNPAELSGEWPMGQVLKVFPAAQRALFQRYHIGGCSSCGYEPSDTLESVARNHGLEAGEVVAFIQQSAELEMDMEISPAEVADLLKKGAIKLVDVRTPQEYEIARIEGSHLADQALIQEMVHSWPKDTPIVTVCHHGMRSLDAVAYLRGHGLRNTRSMSGGIDVWSKTVDPRVPRY
jgi:rhodanese-related sulfurtransferase